MKTFTLIVITILTTFLVGCEDKPNEKNTVTEPKGIQYYSHIDNDTNRDLYQSYYVVVIDRCEYICYTVHGFSHKGNCTNSIHIYNTTTKN